MFVGMWRVGGNPNPCTDLDKILHVHHHLSMEGFNAGLTPHHLPPGPGWPEILNLKVTIYKTKDVQQVAN